MRHLCVMEFGKGSRGQLVTFCGIILVKNRYFVDLSGQSEWNNNRSF